METELRNRIPDAMIAARQCCKMPVSAYGGRVRRGMDEAQDGVSRGMAAEARR